MTDWLAAGGLVDIALVCVVIEALVLWALRSRWSGVAAPSGVAANLAAGGLLMLAVRVAIGGGHWLLIAAYLTGALVAHVADIGSRLGLIGRSGR